MQSVGKSYHFFLDNIAKILPVLSIPSMTTLIPVVVLSHLGYSESVVTFGPAHFQKFTVEISQPVLSSLGPCDTTHLQCKPLLLTFMAIHSLALPIRCFSSLLFC